MPVVPRSSQFEGALPPAGGDQVRGCSSRSSKERAPPVRAGLLTPGTGRWCLGVTRVPRVGSRGTAGKLRVDSAEDLPADHGGNRRADLVVWSPTNRPIAIELQHSAP
jgi:hypothetical protein